MNKSSAENAIPTLREHIEAHPDVKAGRAIAIPWSIDDILELEGPDGRYPITERGAAHVLETVMRKHDPSHGITWDTLEDAVIEYLRENANSLATGEAE